MHLKEIHQTLNYFSGDAWSPPPPHFHKYLDNYGCEMIPCSCFREVQSVDACAGRNPLT